MAGADASIYSLIAKPAQMPDPLSQYGQAMQIKNLMGQGRMQDMQMAELERANAERMKLRDLFSSGNVTPEAVSAISPEMGLKYQQHLRDTQKSEAELRRTKMETFAKGVGILKDRLPTVRDQASFDAYRDTAVQLLGPDQVVKLNLPTAYDPNWVRNQLVKADELFTPKPQEIKMPDGSLRVMDMNPFTNPEAVNFQAAAAMTPADRARLGELQAHNTEMERQGAERLRFDTGVTLPARQVTAGQPSAAPAATPAAPATPAAMPVSAPAPAPAAPGLTPKQQQELALEKEKRRAAAQEALPGVIQKAEEGIGLIDQMIGTKGLELKPGQEEKAPHPGFETFVGATLLPGLRFVEGTDTAGFQTIYDQVKGKAFLEAFESLKGGGQITQIEGEKATQAITRMNKAQNEKEFIKAAREFQGIMRNGIERAKAKARGPAQPAAGSGGIKFLGYE